MSKKTIQTAVKMCEKAYAPFSKYKVGSAVEIESGEIIGGCNIESSSYGLTCCAERVALSTASTNYPGIKIKKIAITANSKNFNLTEPAGPCGLCRQVLIEFESKQGCNIELLLFNDNKVIKFASVKNLLPFYFQETQLKKSLL